MASARDRASAPNGGLRALQGSPAWRRAAGSELALPVVALVAILALTFAVNSSTFSYFGINLLLLYAVPLMLAAIAQMFVIVAATSTWGSARSSASSTPSR